MPTMMIINYDNRDDHNGDDQDELSLLASSMSWSVRSGKMQPSPTSLESYHPSMQSPDIDMTIL